MAEPVATPVATPAFSMPLDEAMRTQRAIRRLKSDPVDDTLVLQLVELAAALRTVVEMARLDTVRAFTEGQQREVVRVDVRRHRPPPVVGGAVPASGGCGS